MAKKTFNFKKAFEELETIEQWFENENLDVDAGLKKYEEGMRLINDAQKHLKDVKNKFKKISV